jgi:type IV secretory pathway TraG/TraD family ATPase VirD4
MKIDTYNTLNNKDASVNTKGKLVVTILSLLLFNVAIASTEGLLDKEINKENFILDELPALRKIPSLPTALAESRKYDGCFVAVLQNIYQIQEIYGSVSAACMITSFNNKFMFRVSDQQNAHISALMVGKQQTLQTEDSLSHGSNTMPDGITINNIERKTL